MDSYLQRLEFDDQGYVRLIRLPAYEVAEVVVDPARGFGQPIFVRGGARLEDALGCSAPVNPSTWWPTSTAFHAITWKTRSASRRRPHPELTMARGANHSPCSVMTEHRTGRPQLLYVVRVGGGGFAGFRVVGVDLAAVDEDA